MRAHIISIGNELLLGEIIDTNSTWLAEMLTDTGIHVTRLCSVGDQREAIVDALSISVDQADVVLLTGGLGPTSDDITRNVLADYLGVELLFVSQVAKDIEDFLSRRGVSAVNPKNNVQTMVPKGCEVIRNKYGTAPGLWFERGDTTVIAMPGVPHEMRAMVTDDVLERLRKRSKGQTIVRKTVLTIGIPEAQLADMLAPWQERLDPAIQLAYLPSPGLVRLRLTASGENAPELRGQINGHLAELTKILGEDIFGYERVTMAEVVGALLKNKDATVSTAESCSGGSIARLITAVPGSSDYFLGSVVAYANEIKTALLGVNPASIEQHGAVSKEVVEQMAQGARSRIGTDYAVATSGIAGPGGGTKEKPVGTVWIAVASKKRTISKKFQFGERRDVNIDKSAMVALDMLRRMIRSEGHLKRRDKRTEKGSQ